MQYHVCRTEDIRPGEKRSFTVKNIPIVISRNIEGKFFAIYGLCPHQRADLGKGVLVGLNEAAQAGDAFTCEREGEILRCPWHGFSFDVTTGACLTDPDRLRVKTFPVIVDNQNVLINI